MVSPTGDDSSVIAWNPDVTESYVAFVDVLGFSDRILSDFDSALEVYRGFVESARMFSNIASDVSVRVYSDALLVTSHDLIPLVQALQPLSFLTLASDCLVRGGVGFGRHAQQDAGNDTLVVSQALTRAVAAEKRVGHPCIALDDSVVTPDEAWLYNGGNFERPILYFDGIRIVNPFNLFWGVSAGARVEAMREAHPDHADKFDWFLRLYEAVREAHLLVPSEYEQYFEFVSVPRQPNA